MHKYSWLILRNDLYVAWLRINKMKHNTRSTLYKYTTASTHMVDKTRRNYQTNLKTAWMYSVNVKYHRYTYLLSLYLYVTIIMRIRIHIAYVLVWKPFDFSELFFIRRHFLFLILFIYFFPFSLEALYAYVFILDKQINKQTKLKYKKKERTNDTCSGKKWENYRAL